MITLNIHEAKTHLSRYLAELEPGDVIVLCRRNVPIAEIHALPRPRTEPRPIGLARGRIAVPQDFNAPLPDHVLAEFEGSARSCFWTRAHSSGLPPAQTSSPPSRAGYSKIG